MSLDPDEIATIQDENLRKKLGLSSFEYETLEADLEALKQKFAIERLEREREE